MINLKIIWRIESLNNISYVWFLASTKISLIISDYDNYSGGGDDNVKKYLESFEMREG